MSYLDEDEVARTLRIRMEQIIDGLPPEDQEVVRHFQQTMYQNNARAAAAAIMARNFSHGIGRYVLQCIG